MKLILAEKPELGNAIAAAIWEKPVFNKDGSINCGEYTVSLHGRGLCIEHISSDFVSVSGDLEKIEYETVKKR